MFFFHRACTSNSSPPGDGPDGRAEVAGAARRDRRPRATRARVAGPAERCSGVEGVACSPAESEYFQVKSNSFCDFAPRLDLLITLFRKNVFSNFDLCMRNFGVL